MSVELSALAAHRECERVWVVRVSVLCDGVVCSPEPSEDLRRAGAVGGLGVVGRPGYSRRGAPISLEHPVRAAAVPFQVGPVLSFKNFLF